MKSYVSLLPYFSQEGRDDLKKRPKPAPRFISIQDVKYVLVTLVTLTFMRRMSFYVVLHGVVMHSPLLSTFFLVFHQLVDWYCMSKSCMKFSGA